MAFPNMSIHDEPNMQNHHNQSNDSTVASQQQFSDCFYPDTLETIASPAIQQFLIVLYTLTSFLALSGNVIVIAVQLQNQEPPRQSAIRKYLINLAVADIIFGVLCVPFTYTDFMLGRWVFPNWMCPTTQYAQLLSVFITANTLTIIGIERYTATLHPFSDFHHWLQSNSYTLISLTWIIGAFYSYIPIEHTYIQEYISPDNETFFYECSYDNDLGRLKKRIYMGANFVLTFAIPLIVLVCAYTAIMRRVMVNVPGVSEDTDTTNNTTTIAIDNSNCSHQHVVLTDSDVQNGGFEMKLLNRLESPKPVCKEITFRRTYSMNNNKHRSKTIKIILIVIILYCICWMPIKLYQFLVEYEIIWFCSETQYYIQIYGYFVVHWLAMANSFVNPIVYSFMSQRFRDDLRRIFRLT